MGINCGQVWKVEKDKYEGLVVGTYAVILSCDDDFWKVADFWFCDHPEWGGARLGDYTEKEITETMVYVGHLRDFVKEVKNNE